MHPDRSRTYRILGRAVRVEFDESRGADVLREELSLYPAVPAGRGADLFVRYRPVGGSGGGLVNPTVHAELEDGFVMHHTMADVRFYLEGTKLAGIDFYPAASSSRALSYARKFLDMQYSSREERSGVAFHELVAVPAAHWLTDLVVVHASGIADDEGRVTLIGGTGGVGKTSLELELCLNRGYSFVSDDIAFVSDRGHVWPNLAYPKIYAYNLEDNPALASRLLAGRNAADRLHWILHRQRGASFVRRRINPEVLYGSVNREGGRLARYIVLVRENRYEPEVETVDARRAAAMTVSLMPPEYFLFHNHLHWHVFNRAVEGLEPSIVLSETLERWRHMLAAVFENVSCLVVRVPVGMDHTAFKHEMAQIIMRPT